MGVGKIHTKTRRKGLSVDYLQVYLWILVQILPSSIEVNGEQSDVINPLQNLQRLVFFLGMDLQQKCCGLYSSTADLPHMKVVMHISCIDRG